MRFDGEIGGIGGDSGGIDYRLSTRFERPATFSPDTSLFLLARLEDLDDPDYKERNVQLGGGLSHTFSEMLTGEGMRNTVRADLERHADAPWLKR